MALRAAGDEAAARWRSTSTAYRIRKYVGGGHAEQVAKIRRILEELGLDIATPAEARAILGTKGADNVAF